MTEIKRPSDRDDPAEGVSQTSSAGARTWTSLDQSARGSHQASITNAPWQFSTVDEGDGREQRVKRQRRGDILIHPDLYAPSGFDMMGILVGPLGLTLWLSLPLPTMPTRTSH